jgi:Zn-dependent membrane protease YugP
MFFMGFDPTFVLLIPAMIFAFWAQWKVQSTYKKMSRVRAANGKTGCEMAQSIMTRNGLSGVGIEQVDGFLTDHYDPRAKKVRLSANSYQGDSLASIAVAAHEVGHALQHANGYAPLVIRSAIAPVAGFASTLAFPLFLIGMFFRSGMSSFFMDLGILFFSGAVLFQFVTGGVQCLEARAGAAHRDRSHRPAGGRGGQAGAGRRGPHLRGGGRHGGAAVAEAGAAPQQPAVAPHPGMKMAGRSRGSCPPSFLRLCRSDRDAGLPRR